MLCKNYSNSHFSAWHNSNYANLKVFGIFFAKYPPKSPRIQRLKFVCTCPTTCPSRTTRTLNSACWRRTINIQGVFIQRKNIKISILGDHFMGSSHCDHQQQSWSRWHWNSGRMSPWIFFSPSLQVENQIDLTSDGQNNKEISMRISSSISSGENFFTDLNGFQVTAFTVNQNTEEINFFFADDPPEALREAAPSS